MLAGTAVLPSAVKVNRAERPAPSACVPGRAVGLVALPALLLFDILGPILELSGYLVTLAGFLLGLAGSTGSAIPRWVPGARLIRARSQR